ncbi:MAG: RNA methyltransferase [Candidatus Babeliales bacterium]
MKISIITVFPEFYQEFIKTSLIAKSVENKIIEFNFIRLSDMTLPGQRIDEPVCGPGSGMIIKPEIWQNAIETCINKYGDGVKIFFSPQGKKLTQPILRELTDKIYFKKKNNKNLCPIEADLKSQEFCDLHLILICARYEGIDPRVEKYYADYVISIGDYVLMGGDLPAQVFIESFLRLIPGIVGRAESVEKESFESPFLDYPEYGLPAEWNGLKIPDIVRSGNHAQIEKWRKEQAAQNTIYKRFDWFASSNPEKADIDLAKKFIPNHYVALMHNNVLIEENKEGHSSITSLDIHDIARSATTYGIKNYFVVSELEDQQKILNTFLGFWSGEEGKEYNKSRSDAVNIIIPAITLEQVIFHIEKENSAKPIIIATSAKISKFENKLIDYFSQGIIFEQKRPVLFLFGTGKGLSDNILNQCDYILLPINGMTDYNHLSVRSAAAIIFDRWLGLNTRYLR